MAHFWQGRFGKPCDPTAGGLRRLRGYLPCRRPRLLCTHGLQHGFDDFEIGVLAVT
jgi:hypothetical protein